MCSSYTTAMSVNTVVLDDECIVYNQITSDTVFSYKTTLLGKYLGEQERLSPEAACGWLMYFHKQGYQITTE